MNHNAHGVSTLSLPTTRREVGKRGGAQTELEKARAEAAALRAEASAARERAEKLKANMLRSSRDAKVRLRVTAMIMMTAALVKLGWEAAHAPVPVPIPAIAQPLPASGGAIGSAHHAGDSAGWAEPGAGMLALERLRTAFHSFPGEDQWVVVHDVNQKFASIGLTCPLEWRNGIPALYVGEGKDAASPSVVAALNQCAAGVEKLRTENDAVKTQ